MTNDRKRETNNGPTHKAQLLTRSKLTTTMTKKTMTTTMTDGRTNSSPTTATQKLTKGIDLSMPTTPMTTTPMTITPAVTTTPTRTTLSQPTTNRQRRKRVKEEEPPQDPYGFPVIPTGQSRGQLKREKLLMFWSQSAQNTTLPSSWQTMDWIVSMKSRS